MYHALDLGLSMEDFWEVSPRTIWVLQQQLIRTIKRKKAPEQEAPRLNYIPR